MEKKNICFSCVDCSMKNCDSGKKTYPKFCVSQNLDPEIREEVKRVYLEDDENNRVMQASAEVECDYYCRLTRVQETIEWAKKLGAKKIGIASCVGLLKESGILAKVLRSHGFEVYGAGCKVGEIPKTEIGIDQRCMEVGANMCNPILQAKLLAKEKTDINIVMGLCVGHDSLFYKYSEALTTTLVTKDRVLGHNPVAALYTADTYYEDKLFQKTTNYSQEEKV